MKNKFKRLNRLRHLRKLPKPTKSEISEAVENYLNRGGKITVVVPKWTDEILDTGVPPSDVDDFLNGSASIAVSPTGQLCL